MVPLECKGYLSVIYKISYETIEDFRSNIYYHGYSYYNKTIFEECIYIRESLSQMEAMQVYDKLNHIV